MLGPSRKYSKLVVMIYFRLCIKAPVNPGLKTSLDPQTQRNIPNLRPQISACCLVRAIRARRAVHLITQDLFYPGCAVLLTGPLSNWVDEHLIDITFYTSGWAVRSRFLGKSCVSRLYRCFREGLSRYRVLRHRMTDGLELVSGAGGAPQPPETSAVWLPYFCWSCIPPHFRSVLYPPFHQINGISWVLSQVWSNSLQIGGTGPTVML